MKKLVLSFGLTFAFLFYGCSSNSNSVAYESVTIDNVADEEETLALKRSESETQASSVSESSKVNQSRKLIYKGEMEIVADSDSFSRVRDNVNALILKFNGYKEKDQSHINDHRFVARIPSESYLAFYESLNKVGGRVVSKSFSVDDATDKYNDVQSAIKSKESALEQYRILLKRASKISEILDIQQRIDDIQEDLNRTNARLLSLNRSISYGTLSIDLRVKHASSDDGSGGFFSELADAIVGGWHGVQFVVVALFYLWPLVLVVGIVLFFLRRRKTKRNSQN